MLYRFSLSLLLYFFVSNIYAQTESVYLHVDHVIAYTSDTIWYRGFVFDYNRVSNLSTCLNVELYNETNQLSTREVFPILNGISIGQIVMPNRPGLYWLRAYTGNSNDYIISITVRDGSPVVTRKLLDYKESPVTTESKGIVFNSMYTEKGISCSLFPESDTSSVNKEFDLVVKYYDTKIGEYPFILYPRRQKNILISSDSLKGYVHGYITLEFYSDSILVARQNVFVPQKKVPVELTRDSGKYILVIKDSSQWNYSLSVVQVPNAAASTTIQHALTAPGKRRITDTSYLNYKGIVSSTSGKRRLIKNEDLITILEKDSSTSNQLIPIDSLGRISLSGFYFFDTAKLHYMLNGWEGDRLSDIQLSMIPGKYLRFVAPDSLDYELDTLNIPPSWKLPDFDTLKYLKPAIVTPFWHDRNKGLDTRYTTGRFTWPAHFSYDLRDTIKTKYTYNIFDYLRRELPWFTGGDFGEPRFKRKPAVFYLDEEVISWQDLQYVPMRELAYVKVIEDFPVDNAYELFISGIRVADLNAKLAKSPAAVDVEPAMICIYTRKGKDYRPIPGKLNVLPVKGFNRPLEWNHPDRTTLLWVPYINTLRYTFALPDQGGHSYKIIVEGVNSFGETFHFEKMIKP